MSNIGETIRHLRKQRGMTQDELAAGLHVTRQTVSNYENGKSEPDLDMLMVLAAVLDTDAAALLSPDAPARPHPRPDPRRVRGLLLGAGILVLLWAGLGHAADMAAVYFRSHYGGCWTLWMLCYDAELCVPIAAGYLLGCCHLLLSPPKLPRQTRAVHWLLLALLAFWGIMVIHDLAGGAYIDVLYWQQKAAGGGVNIQFGGFLPWLWDIRYRLLLTLKVNHKSLGILLPWVLGYLTAITKPNTQ